MKARSFYTYEETVPGLEEEVGTPAQETAQMEIEAALKKLATKWVVEQGFSSRELNQMIHSCAGLACTHAALTAKIQAMKKLLAAVPGQQEDE